MDHDKKVMIDHGNSGVIYERDVRGKKVQIKDILGDLKVED